ncbi:MAG: type I restriction endonuclease subunit R [Sulfurospirillum sp.]|nr:type I restriction endonuclease subunit R [Sulfurospirillum sp.]
MTFETKPIAQSHNFIILDKYTNIEQSGGSYQSEADLENELIKDLLTQGYEFLKELTTPKKMLVNVRKQLQKLNKVEFKESEWNRFVEEYLDKPSDNSIDKTRKIHDDYIYDFVFDDGRIVNIYLFDKINLAKNRLQVIKQFAQSGTQANRYDVTILVNGLPLVQIELKKRGVSIREAFNQVHRYSKESFNSENSLYKYLQIFVISNGTDSRYFANTTKRDKNSFDFTMNWAKSDNTLIKDLKDFTATFLQKKTLLDVLMNYSVFDVSDTLLIMRPYQIAATERLIWKVKSSYETKKHSSIYGAGFVWHTTGSGKTLTSFKAARLATGLSFIDKVFFVVDRKDLDFQTMKEYQRFSPNSVNGSENTAKLKKNIEKDDNKIIVTTIQKLNNLMKNENNLDIYSKQVVFIFDEAHRSQFGEAQKNLTKKFKKYYQFGFTGTPIFPQNALGSQTTASVFGTELHSYVITDAVRDEKVLKFKVDYNDVRPEFKNFEREIDEKKLSAFENKQALQHPKRIDAISKYILNNFNKKTHRLQMRATGFNAMFAVSSIDSAKLYYEAFKNLQAEKERPLKVATIFSFVTNETQNAVGSIEDESFEPNAMDTSAKEFLSSAIDDYNKMFKSSHGVDSKGFQNYYRDLAKRVKNKEVDLLIVVGMFLTGFDAPTLNTLFVDKNLRYHGLMQAFSRTNRIYDATKTFGNIVTFRDLEKPTIEAITLFGNKNTKNIVLEKSYDEQMKGFIDIISGEVRRGYLDIIKELKEKFPNPEKIEKDVDKKEFAKVFGEYLIAENILQNYDEFSALKELQDLDTCDVSAVEEFKAQHYLSDEDFTEIQNITIPLPRTIQDYKSTYNDIREWIRREKKSGEKENSNIDWSDIVFEIDLLKSQEINLDYIIELIYEHNKKAKDKPELIDEVKRAIRAGLGHRAKEGLVIDFINKTDLNSIDDKANIIEKFYKFALLQQQKEAEKLISDENLKEKEAKRYIKLSLKKGYASEDGTELKAILPDMSPLNPKYLIKKQRVFEKIYAFIEKFKGVGGTV